MGTIDARTIKEDLTWDLPPEPEYIFDDSPVEPGDVLMLKRNQNSTTGFKPGHLYLVRTVSRNRFQTYLDSSGSAGNGWLLEYFQKVKTMDSSHTIKGDTIICIARGIEAKGNNDSVKVGERKTCQKTSTYMYWSDKTEYNNGKSGWVTIRRVNHTNNIIKD